MKYFKLFLLFFTFIACLIVQAQTNSKNKLYWYNRNYELIRLKISSLNLQPEDLARVKNVVLFVGDGMGLSTITASRVHKRQKTGKPEEKLIFDDFTTTALIQTDIANSQISESAAAATALFSGVKTTSESLGVDETAGDEICTNLDSYAPSLFSWAQSQNIKTGFVTTTRITHATPAALFAHSRRYSEDDSKSEDECKDIALQLIEDEPGNKINVVMGGGLRSFLPKSEDPETTSGRRLDERNLTEEWLASHDFSEFVTNRSEMLSISEETENVLGIFAPSHMHFNADRNPDEEPSLAEMTKVALDVLNRNNNRGFILVVEAGKIDLAHHNNNAFRALDDTLALDEAVEVAYRRLDLSESLVIVTADHASSLVYSGYSTPKNFSILGMDQYVSNISKKPYQLLMYSSGIGHRNYNEAFAMKDHRNSYHKSAVPSTWANHGAEDVPLYAVGALANTLFSGSLDQTYIPHAIAFAMCLVEHEDRCRNSANEMKYESRIRKPNKIQLIREQLQNRLGNFSELAANETEENSKSERICLSFVCFIILLVNFVC